MVKGVRSILLALLGLRSNSLFFFSTMIRSSCSCHPFFRCGFLIPSSMCRSFKLSIVFRQASSIFYSLFVKLLGRLKREAERFLFKNLTNVAPIFDVSSFAFTRWIIVFHFWPLLFRFLICKRYNLLSIDDLINFHFD